MQTLFINYYFLSNIPMYHQYLNTYYKRLFHRFHSNAPLCLNPFLEWVEVCSLLSCIWPHDTSRTLLGSSVHGILQARILECVEIPFSRESSQPKDQTQASCIAAYSLLSEPPGKPSRSLNLSLNLWYVSLFF